MSLEQGLMTTDGINLNEILYGTVLPTVEVYNRQEILDLRALLCSDADESYIKFDVSGNWKFEKLGEGQMPQSKKIVWGKTQKDAEKYGLNIGYTYDWLMSDLASSENIRRMINKAIEQDRALQTAIVLDECLQTGGWFDGTFTAAEVITAPVTFGANTFTGAHTHYNTAGSATLTLATITSMKEHVKHHGFKGQLWGLMNANMTKAVEDLAGWTAAATVPVSSKIVDEVAIEGFTGRLLGVNWKECEWMPDNYLLLVGTYEGRAGEKPLRYIQKKNPAARGLILTPGTRPDYPIINSAYIHWLESKIIIRGAGVVYQLSTASAYTAPSITDNVIELGY
jgi:hypothetical protein